MIKMIKKDNIDNKKKKKEEEDFVINDSWGIVPSWPAEPQSR